MADAHDNKIIDKLTSQQVEICWNKGTEAAFTGKYVHCDKAGTYVCVCCGNSLFESETKFDSGSGWPSFWDVVSGQSLKTIVDTSHGMQRIEVICKSCGAHLGHVFEDGPEPTGLRYCINSLALDLKERK